MQSILLEMLCWLVFLSCSAGYAVWRCSAGEVVRRSSLRRSSSYVLPGGVPLAMCVV